MKERRKRSLERLGPDPWMELPLKKRGAPAFILQGTAFLPFGVGTKSWVKDSLASAVSGQAIASSAVWVIFVGNAHVGATM